MSREIGSPYGTAEHRKIGEKRRAEHNGRYGEVL